MLQVKHGQPREDVTDTFTQTTEEYNFKRNRGFRIPSVNTMYHDSQSTSYLGPKSVVKQQKCEQEITKNIYIEKYVHIDIDMY